MRVHKYNTFLKFTEVEYEKKNCPRKFAASQNLPPRAMVHVGPCVNMALARRPFCGSTNIVVRKMIEKSVKKK